MQAADVPLRTHLHLSLSLTWACALGMIKSSTVFIVWLQPTFLLLLHVPVQFKTGAAFSELISLLPSTLYCAFAFNGITV